jgi:hypothetical protein
LEIERQKQLAQL